MSGSDRSYVLKENNETQLQSDGIDQARNEVYLADHLLADNESTGTRLNRVANVLADGFSTGLGKAIDDAIENPGVSSLKVVTAAGLGAGLTLMQRRAGLLRLGGQIVGGSLAYSLLADVAGRTRITGAAIADSWNSDRNLEANKQIVGATLGPFAVDFALMSAGAGIGAGGTGFGLAQWERYSSQPIELPALELGMMATPESVITLPRNSPLARLYMRTRKSVGKIEVLAGQGRGIEGRTSTVFSVSRDGKLATAEHVTRDALDITVFDYKGRPHKARVAGRDEVLAESDIAILQLENPASYKHFKPLELADSTSGEAAMGSFVYGVFGHPNGWGKMYVSPGSAIPSRRGPGVTQRFDMHAQPGYCGGPVCGSDGKVYAMMIQGPRTSNGQIYATPVQHITRVLNGIENGMPAETASWQTARKTRIDFTLASKPEARSNLEVIFGERFNAERPADFFHSRVKQVPAETVQGDGRNLALQMQYNPVRGEVTVKPFALDGKPIPADLTWSGVRTPVSESVLRVRLGKDGMPLSMRAVNDPHLTLQQAFNYRGRDNYLADLKAN